MKKLKHYVIELTVRQHFSSLKDIDAYSRAEAIEKAKMIALENFSRELNRDDIWVETADPEVVLTSVEDEYYEGKAKGSIT